MPALGPVNFLAVCGLSPAVVTESLWALITAQAEIQTMTIITTEAGRLGAEQALLGPQGALARLFADYCPSAALPETRFLVVTDSQNRPLPDITKAADHLALTALLHSTILDLTRDGAPPLYASIAGGRKTMAAALTILMGLYARPIDRLNHVLATAALERDPDFFYPRPGDEQARAGLQLIDMAFPRLRPLLPAAERHQPLDRLIQTVESRFDESDPVIIDLATRQLTLPGTSSLCLPPLLCAVYALLARSAPADSDGMTARDIDLDLLARLYRQAGASALSAAALVRRLAADDPQPWLLEQFARLRAALTQKLGPVGAAHFGILRSGRRPATRYCLALPASRLVVRP